MADLVDRTIATLRDMHDELTALVEGLSDEQLAGQSGATEWTVADVLAHLGSSSEIALATLSTATTDASRPENQEIWDHWNALSPRAQAQSFIVSEERLVGAYEALTADQRENLVVDLGFLPAPVQLSVPLGMRLNEMAAHGWDVRVGVDPDARLHADAAGLVLEHYSDGMAFLLGFSGKADAIDGFSRVGVGNYLLEIDDGIRLTRGVHDQTATFDGPLEAFVRLMSGRLDPEQTPADVSVSGDLTLDDLRRVFPGY